MHSEVKYFVFIGFWFILILFKFEKAKCSSAPETAAERLPSLYVPPHIYVK